MKTISKINIFLLLAILFFACAKDDTPNSEQPEVKQNDIAVIDTKVATFLSTYNAPGASIAISKDGKLVYSKAYGNADVSANQKVTVDDRFRVASVSKVITAVSVMKLIEQGKIGIDDKVFGTGAILGTTYGTTASYSANVKAITVRHLLQHTAGWRNIWPGDPAFQQPSLNQSQLIGWAINNVPVSLVPGTRYQYSNLGYIVLGRIIEKVSGKSYEKFIQQDILEPLGARHIQVAGITEAERKPNEVKYYGQGGDISYVYTDPWPRMDAAGGLIATPTDLVRLLCAIDGFSTKPDILNAASLKTMTTPTLNGTYNGCGLFYDKDDALGEQWYHFGTLPGCQSLVLRTSKGFNIAFTTNTRYTNGSASLNAIATLASQILRVC